MKKYVVAVLCLILVTVTFSVSAADYEIAWYAPMVHPYFDAVKKGVEAFEKDSGIEVLKQIGQEWTQDNQNQNVEALAAKGYKAFSIYPVDASATNGLYEELTDRGMFVTSFGTSTLQPTTASFAVATDRTGVRSDVGFVLQNPVGEGLEILVMLGNSASEDSDLFLQCIDLLLQCADYGRVDARRDWGGHCLVSLGSQRVQRR